MACLKTRNCNVKQLTSKRAPRQTAWQRTTALPLKGHSQLGGFVRNRVEQRALASAGWSHDAHQAAGRQACGNALEDGLFACTISQLVDGYVHGDWVLTGRVGGSARVAAAGTRTTNRQQAVPIVF